MENKFPIYFKNKESVSIFTPLGALTLSWPEFEENFEMIDESYFKLKDRFIEKCIQESAGKNMEEKVNWMQSNCQNFVNATPQQLINLKEEYLNIFKSSEEEFIQGVASTLNILHFKGEELGKYN
jgi:hypothetical protein